MTTAPRAHDRPDRGLTVLWVIVTILWTIATLLRIRRSAVAAQGWLTVIESPLTWVALTLPPFVFALILAGVRQLKLIARLHRMSRARRVARE